MKPADERDQLIAALHLRRPLEVRRDRRSPLLPQLRLIHRGAIKVSDLPRVAFGRTVAQRLDELPQLAQHFLVQYLVHPPSRLVRRDRSARAGRPRRLRREEARGRLGADDNGCGRRRGAQKLPARDAALGVTHFVLHQA